MRAAETSCVDPVKRIPGGTQTTTLYSFGEHGKVHSNYIQITLPEDGVGAKHTMHRHCQPAVRAT